MTTMNYQRFLSFSAKLREPCKIRLKSAKLSQYASRDILFLAGGYPCPEFFPFKEAELTLQDGSKLKMTTKDMQTAQQYGPSNGDFELLDYVKTLHREIHNPPTMDLEGEGGLDLMITCGGQEGLGKVVDMLVMSGDNVIIEGPTFSGLIETLRPTGCNMLTVETDKEGMIPDKLREVLSRWKPEDKEDPKSNIPRVLFTIPNGCNPSGATLTYERKTEIYQIAREYDMIIVEDDPYFFLQYRKPVPSFMSFDVDGRVIRIDSFSKILSPGIRLAYMSGPRLLIEIATRHVMTSSLQPASLSQKMVLKFLKNLGTEGFKDRVKKIQDYYHRQMEAMTSSLERWLTDYCEWYPPTAGMFYWVKINGIKDTEDLIDNKLFLKEVMMMHGGVFYPHGNPTCPYFRASFAFCTADIIDKAMERLASVIKEELENQKQ